MRKTILNTIKKTFIGVLTATVLLTSTPSIVKADTYSYEWNEIYADYKDGYIDKSNTRWNPSYGVTLGTYRYNGNDETRYVEDESILWEKQRVKIKYHKGAEYKVTSSNPKVLKATVKGNYIYFEGVSTGTATIYLKRKINGTYKTVDKITKKVQNSYIRLKDYSNYNSDGQNYSLGETNMNLSVEFPKYGYHIKTYVDKEGIEVKYYNEANDGYGLFKLNATKVGTYTLTIKETNGTTTRTLKKVQVTINNTSNVSKLTVKKHEELPVTKFVKYLEEGYGVDLELVNGKTIKHFRRNYVKHVVLNYNAEGYTKQLLGIQNNSQAMFNKAGTVKVKVYTYKKPKFGTSAYFDVHDTSERVYIGTTTVTITK